MSYICSHTRLPPALVRALVHERAKAEVQTRVPSRARARPPETAAASTEAPDDWFATYTPNAASQALPVEEPVSYTHVRVPPGYELVQKAGVDPAANNAKVDLPSVAELGADARAMYWDPFAIVEQLGYRDRPSAVSYAALNAMVWRAPIIHAIIQTRINQISSFCTPQKHKFEIGFRVKMRDQEAKPTRADKREARRLELALLSGGTTGRDPRTSDSFESFMRKITRDSLIYDQLCFEVVPDRRGRPAEWYAVDASSIRLANSPHLGPTRDLSQIRTVQVYDNTVVEEFTSEEMAFEVRNARSDMRAAGYGMPELEMLVSTVTSILWAWQYNQNFFSQGSVAKGLLNLKGTIPERQLKTFRRQWYNMVSGVENAFRTPITNAEEVEWIDMQKSSRDMEFSAWMDFLIKVACSIFQMDPIEVNFKYGSTNQKSMFEGANKSKLVESKDRGLKPLLRFLGRSLDKYIIWPLNPEFSVDFVGLDSQTPKEMADLFTQRVRTMFTVNELRAEQDYEPLPAELGDLILDANWMNARKDFMAKAAAEEAQKKGEAEVEAQISALAATPAAKVTDEEIGKLAEALAGSGGAAPGSPAAAATPGAAAAAASPAGKPPMAAVPAPGGTSSKQLPRVAKALEETTRLIVEVDV